MPVAIWSINKKDEAALDKYEEFPKLYYKKDMKLEVLDMETNKKSI